MRQLSNALYPTTVSSIGFGCASLGSRIGERDGRAALERAFDAGITWFDVAPSYGDGRAEALLGAFAKSHPGQVLVCTKVGILAGNVGWKSLVRPMARKVVAAVPTLRKYATRSHTVERLPLTPASITASVERSLVALKTDQLDALLLHGALVEEVENDGILHALSRLIADGKVAAAGVASDIEAAAAAARHPGVFSIVQFANNPLSPGMEQGWLADWVASGKLVITHSALGADGALAMLSEALERDGAVGTALRSAGYEGAAKSAAADFLIDYALATNMGGISLFSAMQPRHLASLTERMQTIRDGAEMRRLGKLVLGPRLGL